MATYNNSKNKKRSKMFTDMDTKTPVLAQEIITLYNKKGKKLFSDKNKLIIAENVLRSGKIRVIIPTYEEHQYGAIYKVLKYFSKIVDKKNILVIDADSKDKTGAYVKKRGYHAVEQGRIESCIDLKKIYRDFHVDLKHKRGKGKTILLAAIYQQVALLNPKVKFNLFSDADITNPDKFNHAKYLAWVASHYHEDELIEVKSVQHNRNNQSVMNTIAMMQALNPVIRDYYRVIREMIWPLTGENMKSIQFVNCAPNTLGFCTEMAMNLASADFVKKWKKKIVQIEISTKCLDSKNDNIKEAAMMLGISTTIFAMNEILFKKGIKITAMRPKDYRALNKYLESLETSSEDGFLVSVINSKSSPNELIKIKLDRILPSANYLIENGYVNIKKLKRIPTKN